MSADWTTCRVVRDRDGDLWFRGCDSDDLWTANTNYPDVFLTTDEVLTVFGPLAPVLDADGLPVVHTVGDITARHIGRRVRVDGFEGELVALVALFDGIVTVEVLTDDDLSAPRRCTIDTPVEVIEWFRCRSQIRIWGRM